MDLCCSGSGLAGDVHQQVPSWSEAEGKDYESEAEKGMILLCFDTSDVNQVMRRQWASFMKHKQNKLRKLFLKPVWRKLLNSWKCLYFQNVSWY